MFLSVAMLEGQHLPERTPLAARVEVVGSGSGILSAQKDEPYSPLCNLPGNSFRRLTTSPGNEIFYENMCGTDPHSQQNSVMVFYNPGPDAQIEIATEAVRHLAVRSWKMILPALCEPVVKQLAKYHQEIGIATPGDIANLILLPEHVDYNNHNQVIRYLGQHSKNSVSFLSYMPAPGINELCNQYGIAPACWTPQGMETVITRYSNRSHLRDLIEELGPTVSDKPLVMNNRIKVGVEYSLTRDQLVDSIREAIKWNRGYEPAHPYMLFMQYADGSGGNFPIDHNLTVYGHNFRREHASVEQLADWLYGVSRNNALEITPFARITAAYSFGIVVDDDHVSSVGPRHQLLDQNQSYRGFEYSTLHSNRMENYATARDLCYMLAYEFHGLGFRGAFGVDFFDYLTPDGEKLTAVTETNLRLDGTTPYLGLYFKFPHWHETLFQQGARIAQFSAPLPDLVTPGSSDSLQQAFSYFRGLGIPIANVDSPIGVFATNVPCSSSGTSKIGIGLCATTDGEFYDWIARIDKISEPTRTFV